MTEDKAVTMSLEDAYRIAVDHQRSGDLATATRYYQAILQSYPDHPDVLHNLGLNARQSGQFDKAVALISKAVSQCPDNANFCSSLGITLLNQNKKRDDAADWIRRSIALDPALTLPYSNLGSIRHEAGRMEDARRLLRRAVTLDHDFLDGLHNLMLAEFWVTPVEHWESVCDQFQQMAAFQEGELYDLAVRRAICRWVAADGHALAQALETCRTLSTGLPRAANATEAAIRAYERFLTRLLPTAIDRPVTGQPLPIIGDSHSLSYANTPLTLNGIAYRPTPRLVMGCKAWHLASPGPNRYQWRVQSYLEEVPTGSPVVIAIGEIDCRKSEGILASLGHYGGSVDRAIAQTVDGFVANTIAMARERRLGVSFLGVPAPSRDGADAELASVISRYNSRLRQAVETKGHRFLDVYALTSGPDGMAAGDLHLDEIHLHPRALQMAVDRSQTPP